MNRILPPEERNYLRELAKQYMEVANLPIMEQREKLWYAHNQMISDRPIIVIEEQSFEADILPPYHCQSELGRFIEHDLIMPLTNFEKTGDDKVVPKKFAVPMKIVLREFDREIERTYATDSQGRKIGFHEEHPIKDIERDLDTLRHSTYHVDLKETENLKAAVEEAIGDLVPVVVENKSLEWHLFPSMKAERLLGLENMMFAMIDYPDEVHRLFQFLVDDIMQFLDWQEENHLLTLNNGNHYAGSGSYGFTSELPSPACRQTGIVTTKDLWGNLNSQETSSISPDMFGEFIYPYQEQVAKRFGLVYYGCCEPISDVWDGRIEHLPNLRKVSVSPWCNEEMIGDRLRCPENHVIYSRKPSPNFLGSDEVFNEEGYRAHIAHTLRCAKGCTLEIVSRDVYTLKGDPGRVKRAVQITRELIEEMWQG